MKNKIKVVVAIAIIVPLFWLNWGHFAHTWFHKTIVIKTILVPPTENE